MTKIGIGLPGATMADVKASAEMVSQYSFDSFSVYGDLGDLPPYATLHASAESLAGSGVANVGPMGVPVGMLHYEAIAAHAIALEEQLPGQSYVGLVRGAFLESIGENPASLERLKSTVEHLRGRFIAEGIQPPIYLGGFGPRLLKLAGDLAVDGIKLGGSTNPLLAKRVRGALGENSIKIVLGAVSVIDKDRRAARQLARREVAKYIAVVGLLDTTLGQDELESLQQFNARFSTGDHEAHLAISDKLLDQFAIAGTPEDALAVLKPMEGLVERVEFGTPHGLGDRTKSIRYIAETVLKEMEE